jgi:hypothetical protein
MTWRCDVVCFVFVCTLLLLMASPAVGQEYALFEGFLGASVGNNDFGAVRYTMPGWHISFALNPNHKLRFVADFAGQYRHTNIQSAFSTEKVRIEEDQLLWGPEFTFRRSPKVTPYVHALFGLAGRHYYTPSGDPYYPRDVLAVDHGFASAFGGGADIAVSRRWAVRVVQFDYVLTHMSHDQPQYSSIENQLPALGSWQHNYRLAFGMVLRLGRRGEPR